MRRTIGVLLIVAIAAVTGIAQVPEPVIDGRAESGEYKFLYYNNEIGMWLRWSVVEDTIYLSMEAPATGWVGLNFMPMDGTIHGDTVIGYVRSDQSVHLSDQVAPGDDHFPHFEDIQHGGSDSFLAVAGSELDGITTIEFSRKLMTGEPTDAMFMNAGLMTMISFHPDADDFVSYHSQWYSVVTINYLTGFVNDFPTDVSHVTGHDAH